MPPNLEHAGPPSSRSTRAAPRPDLPTPDPILDWMATKRSDGGSSTIISMDELTSSGNWAFSERTGNLGHRSDRFFTVEGLRVPANDIRKETTWQPILVQHDIAILGIIVSYFDGIPRFLLQAKMEPGNVGLIQLSPTVQATSSCYSGAHGSGRSTPYVEYFTDPRRGQTLVDTLQSEQGSWFYGKRNRNVVVQVDDDVPLRDEFRWTTVNEVRAALRQPNVVNMDARSVLACLVSETPNLTGISERVHRDTESAALHSTVKIHSWLTNHKCRHEEPSQLVPLNSIPGLRSDAEKIGPTACATGDFDIVGVRAQAATREVDSWTQPLLSPRDSMLAGLIVRRFRGRLHALIRAEAMPGYRDAVELGPTIRASPFSRTHQAEERAYLDYLLSGSGKVLYDVVQSEEGGRFLHAETRYRVVEADGCLPTQTPSEWLWISLEQLQQLQRHNYVVAVEVRTLLLCLALVPGEYEQQITPL